MGSSDKGVDAAKLKEQQRRLDLAVEATGLGFWELDLTDDSLVWSDRNRELFGVQPDTPLTAEIFLEAVHPEDRDLILKAYREAREAGEEADFSMEYRITTPAGELRWLLVHGRIVARADRPDLVVGTSLDITERKLAEERRTLLVRELAHRAKNGLAVIMAVVAQTARGATSVKAYQEALIARLTAMALSQDLITESDGAAVSLLDLATKVLEPFDLDRFDLDPNLAGAPVSGDIAIGAALLLHEMATNAVKYGALSNPDGAISVLRFEDLDDRAVVEWRESGGPPVKPPKEPGFGTRLLQAALRSRGGQVQPQFETSGFSARLELPTAQ